MAFTKKENIKSKEYSIIDTLNDIRTTGIRTVKIANVPIGIAMNDEDEKNLISNLEKYGELDTEQDIMIAMNQMAINMKIAEDLNTANLTPVKQFTVDGRILLEIDDKLYDIEGNEVTE